MDCRLNMIVPYIPSRFQIAWDHLPYVWMESKESSQNNQTVPDPSSPQSNCRRGLEDFYGLESSASYGWVYNGKSTGKHGLNGLKLPFLGVLSMFPYPYRLERPSHLQA